MELSRDRWAEKLLWHKSPQLIIFVSNSRRSEKNCGNEWRVEMYLNINLKVKLPHWLALKLSHLKQAMPVKFESHVLECPVVTYSLIFFFSQAKLNTYLPCSVSISERLHPFWYRLKLARSFFFIKKALATTKREGKGRRKEIAMEFMWSIFFSFSALQKIYDVYRYQRKNIFAIAKLWATLSEIIVVLCT